MAAVGVSKEGKSLERGLDAGSDEKHLTIKPAQALRRAEDWLWQYCKPKLPSKQQDNAAMPGLDGP